MMMSYDQSGGHHSEYTWGNKMIDQGAAILPEQQVAAGLPFYGMNFGIQNCESSCLRLLLRCCA